MARLIRICLKCDARVLNTAEEFEPCANVIDGDVCGSREWVVVAVPDALFSITVTGGDVNKSGCHVLRFFESGLVVGDFLFEFCDPLTSRSWDIGLSLMLGVRLSRTAVTE